MKITSFTYLVLFCVCSLIFFGCEQNSIKESTADIEAFSIDFVPAKTNNELSILRLQNNNMVKTIRQFDNVVYRKKSPFSNLSESTITSLRNSFVERDGIGIVGFNYGFLKNNLSAEDYKTAMAIFGIDVKEGFWGNASLPKSSPNARPSVDDGGTDYKDYKCESKGSCKSAILYICLSGC